MERKFKVGDHVCVHTTDHKYRGMNLYGKVGTIMDIINDGQYKVRLAGITNQATYDGKFIFDGSSLILQEEMDKKDVLVGDMKNGYSFVTAKDAEELRIIVEGVTYIPLHIEKVIFNNPATIVFWSDGSKTVVKCAGDECFDEEKGLAMAISKKVLGNKGNYYNEFKKWLPENEVWGINGGMSMVEACKKAYDAVESFNKAMKGDK